MDSIIKVTLPKSACTFQITTSGNAIIVRIAISIQIPVGTVSIVIDCCWFSVPAWERGMRTFLEKLVNQRDAIVEAHIRNTLTEDEKRIRDVLCNILGIPNKRYQE